MASNPKTKAQEGVATGLKQDRLTKKQLRALYGYTARQLRVNPQLFGLFQKAYDEQWDQARFDSEVEQLDWYRQTQASAREFLLLQAEGGADFAAKQNDTFEFVRRTAMQMGKNLNNQQLADLTEDTMMFGWGEPGQDYELRRAIVDLPDDGQYGGDIRKNADNLYALALANGVRYDDNWFTSAGKSIAAGLSMAEDYENDIREQAAGLYSVFADKIRAGMNVIDLVSPWRKRMADEWEIDEDSIRLDDPTLLSAIGRVDDKGNPSVMNIGEFQRVLRKDPRWLETDKAQNEITGVTSQVMQMFGLRG